MIKGLEYPVDSYLPIHPFSIHKLICEAIQPSMHVFGSQSRWTEPAQTNRKAQSWSRFWNFVTSTNHNNPTQVFMCTVNNNGLRITPWGAPSVACDIPETELWLGLHSSANHWLLFQEEPEHEDVQLKCVDQQFIRINKINSPGDIIAFEYIRRQH